MKKDVILRRNTISSFSVQIAALLFSFIVPRCIIISYGSEVNGTVTSITGFLGFITLMEAGVASVTRAALFKPVHDQDSRMISFIVNETHSYFQKVVGIYLVMVILFVVLSPSLLHNGENLLYNGSLIFAIAIANIVQYYFGAGYIQVLWADQKVYMLNLIQTLAYIMNIIGMILLISLGASIQIVKLTGSLFFIMKPLFVNHYVKTHYRVDVSLKNEQTVLVQKWDNLLQTVAYYVHSKTDVVILTLLLDLKTVSVYGVYAMITTGLSSVISSMCNGYTVRAGNLYGRNELKKLQAIFDRYERFVFCLTFGAFTIAYFTILDFVMLYTRQMTDANYYQPVFALLIILAEGIYCLRIPYVNMVSVAGHFKETQMPAFAEAFINIVISAIAVKKYGLIGITVGTLIAMAVRGIYLVLYLSKHILYRSVACVIRRCVLYTTVPTGMFLLVRHRFIQPVISNYIQWIYKAGIVAGITSFLILIVYRIDGKLNLFLQEVT